MVGSEEIDQEDHFKLDQDSANEFMHSRNMTMTNQNCGILTMCYEADWHKAIGLSLCLRARESKLQTAVVAPLSLRHKLEPYFNQFIPERTDLTGFSHKVHLDEYSPFQRTLFIDADMLVFRDPQELFDRWHGEPYMARGRPETASTSSFGLCRSEVLKTLGKDVFACIDGAGHAYFEKPSCQSVFARAREVLATYDEWAPEANVADEDIMGIVMTEADITPTYDKSIVGFPKAVRQYTKQLDCVSGECEYIDLDGDHVRPILMHYPRDMTPLRYHLQLRKLDKHLLINTGIPWARMGATEWVKSVAFYTAKTHTKKLLLKD